jgi:hypothetical protein
MEPKEQQLPQLTSTPRSIHEVISMMKVGLDSRPNPPANPEHIANLEKELETPLPPSYREVLGLANGGTFFQNVELFGSTPTDEVTDIASITRLMRQKGLPPHLIPVASSVLTVCLDTTRPDTQNPAEFKITLWNQTSRLSQNDERTFAKWLQDLADQFI